MTAQDRQRLKVLLVLLGVLGVTLWFGYGINRPSTASNVPPAAAQAQPSAPSETGARIRLDLVQSLSAEEEIGRNNVFQYRTRPAPSEPSRPPDVAPPPSVAVAPVPPRPPGPTPPPPPPAPPPIPLKYQGFAVVNQQEGELTAFLSDDMNHYNVTAGEVLVGRYRIVRITERDIEVEDLQLKRRQTLPLITR